MYSVIQTFCRLIHRIEALISIFLTKECNTTIHRDKCFRDPSRLELLYSHIITGIILLIHIAFHIVRSLN